MLQKSSTLRSCLQEVRQHRHTMHTHTDSDICMFAMFVMHIGKGLYMVHIVFITLVVFVYSKGSGNSIEKQIIDKITVWE